MVGLVAYEAAGAFDTALQTWETPPSTLPFAQFAVFRNFSAPPRPRKEHLNGTWQDDTPREQFDEVIGKILHGITDGSYYQINYTTQLRALFNGDGLSFFDKLKASQPSAYCAYLNFGDWEICSVSPELFFHHDRAKEATRTLTCRPMKGTATRHQNTEQDRQAAQELLDSPKERAENLMIVDLVRNDMSRVARLGSVTVPHLFSIEAWPTVWQMTSTITCQTNHDTRLVDIFRALFPCGSITGAPKAAAMSAIKILETAPRGIYCGAIGMVMPGGEALFSVGIRTPVIDVKQARASCGIGSGITLDSKTDNEYAEWFAKQAFLRQSNSDYQLLETLRLHQGRYWLLRGHLMRLERSANTLGFTFDLKHITATLKTEAQQHLQGNWRTRLCLSANGEINIESLPLDTPLDFPYFALAKVPVTSDNPWLRHKTTQREIYTDLASKQAGIFDTLLFNEHNELTEFTRGNLIIELQGNLVTPAATCGLLPGVFREMLIVRKRIKEKNITKEELAHANNIWFINSVRGVIAVKCGE